MQNKTPQNILDNNRRWRQKNPEKWRESLKKYNEKRIANGYIKPIRHCECCNKDVKNWSDHITGKKHKKNHQALLEKEHETILEKNQKFEAIMMLVKSLIFDEE